MKPDCGSTCSSSPGPPTPRRSRVQKWIEQGCFLINGEAAKKNHTMAAGDEVAVAFMPEPDMSSTLVPEDIPFPIAL